MPEHRFKQTIWTAQALDASGTLESPIINCLWNDIQYFALKAVAGGAADVKIQIAVSEDGTTFNDYGDQEDIASTSAALYPTTPDNTHHYLIPAHPYLKIRITELTAAATTITGVLDCSEGI